MSFFGPKNTMASVAKVLADGFREGTISFPGIRPADGRSLRSSEAVYPLSERSKVFFSDPGLPVPSKSAKGIVLSDIFVFPELSHEIDGRIERISSERVFRLAEEPRTVLFAGPDLSGKTTLAKVCFLRCREQGKVPVLINSKTVGQRARPTEYHLERATKLCYSRKVWDHYKTIPRSQRVIIIDDFLLVASRSEADLLVQLRELADTVFVFSDDSIVSTETIWGQARERYTIEPMVHALRSRLIEQWIRSTQEQDDPQGLSLRWMGANKTIDAMVGDRFLPEYPVFLLSVLQAEGGQFDARVSATPSSVGYFYELFVRLRIAIGMNQADFDIVVSYMASLAYDFFREKVSEAHEELITAHHVRFMSKYGIEREQHQIVEVLLEKQLLARTSTGWYSFRYRYLYYYFLACYLGDILDTDEGRRIVTELAYDLGNPESAHPILFLCHRSRSDWLHNTLLNAAAQVLASVPPGTLGDEFFESSKEPLEFQERGSDRGRAALSEALDKRRLARRRSPTPIREEKAFELAKALRTQRVLGQVLRNFPGTLVMERKVALCGSCLDLSERILTFVLDLLRSEVGVIRDDLQERLRYYHPAYSSEIVTRRTEHALSQLKEVSVYSVVKRFSYAVGSRDLFPVWKKLMPEHLSPVEDLAGISIVLDQSRDLPFKEIRRLAKRYRNHSLLLAVLRRLVTLRFDLFDDDYREKQSTCDLLGIRYRPGRPLPLRARRPPDWAIEKEQQPLG